MHSNFCETKFEKEKWKLVLHPNTSFWKFQSFPFIVWFLSDIKQIRLMLDTGEEEQLVIGEANEFANFNTDISPLKFMFVAWTPQKLHNWWISIQVSGNAIIEPIE